MSIVRATMILVTLAATVTAVTGLNLTFGQSCALSGPTKSLGIDMRLGIRAAFEEQNRAGGVAGFYLQLESRDDGYEPEAALANTRHFLNDSNVFALIGEVGTPTSKAVMPLVVAAKMPFIGPFTGAKFLRNPYQRYVLNYRASYIDETSAMVQHSVQVRHFTRISILYQADSFGAAGYEGLSLALRARSMVIESEGTYPRNTLQVESGLASIRANGKPQSIVMIGAYKPLAKFVRLAKAVWPDMVFYSVSFVGFNALSQELGSAQARRNVIVTQVVPPPAGDSLPLVRRYAAALAAVDSGAQRGFVSLEGYLVGRLAITMVRHAATATALAGGHGGMISREAFLDAALVRGVVDIGEGMRLGPYGGDCEQIANGCRCNQGMREVYYTKIRDDGRELPFGEPFRFTSCGYKPPQPMSLLFGQSSAFSGPASALGIAMRHGIRAAFAEANRYRPNTFRLVTYDDGYEPAPAIANTQRLIHDDQVFALIGQVGTPTAKVVLPLAQAARVPLLGAFTGAGLLRRPFTRYAVNVRASYGDETACMVNLFVRRMGFSRISILYQADSYGQAGLTGLKHALWAGGLQLSVESEGTYPRNTVDVLPGLESIRNGGAARPQAIVMIGAYKPLARFVEEAKKVWPDMWFATVSFVGSTAFSDHLATPANRRRVLVTQVVPLPSDTSHPAVAAYTEALASYNSSVSPGFVSLEGYIAGRLAVMMADRIGRASTSLREGFLDAAFSLQQTFRFDNLTLGPFTQEGQCNQGMREVWMTAVQADGTYRDMPEAHFTFPDCGFIDFRYPPCGPKFWAAATTACDSATQTTSTSYKWPHATSTAQPRYCRAGEPLPVEKQQQCAAVMFSSLPGALFTALLALQLLALIAAATYLALHLRCSALSRSQPRFLLIMCAGGCLALVGQILLKGDATPSLCAVRAALHPSVGVSVLLAATMARVWRIRVLFVQAELRRVTVTNGALYWRIATIVVAHQLILVVGWLLVPPSAVVPYSGLHSSPAQKVCAVSAGAALADDLFTLLLIALTCVLAYSVKDVPGDFQEGHSILLASYNMTVATFVVRPLFLAIDLPVVTKAVASDLSLSCVVSGTLALILIPKISAVRHNYAPARLNFHTATATTVRRVAPSPVRDPPSASSPFAAPRAQQHHTTAALASPTP